MKKTITTLMVGLISITSFGQYNVIVTDGFTYAPAEPIGSETEVATIRIENIRLALQNAVVLGGLYLTDDNGNKTTTTDWASFDSKTSHSSNYAASSSVKNLESYTVSQLSSGANYWLSSAFSTSEKESLGTSWVEATLKTPIKLSKISFMPSPRTGSYGDTYGTSSDFQIVTYDINGNVIAIYEKDIWSYSSPIHSGLSSDIYGNERRWSDNDQVLYDIQHTFSLNIDNNVVTSQTKTAPLDF